MFLHEKRTAHEGIDIENEIQSEACRVWKTSKLASGIREDKMVL